MKDLSMNKAVSGDIPVKMLIESGFIFLYLVNCINEVIINCDPETLYSACLEKESPTDKKNSGPVSILPVESLWNGIVWVFTNTWIRF